ncbi:MAG: ribosomal RNA adenine dimethylase [Gemmataceae bacterium]
MTTDGRKPRERTPDWLLFFTKFLRQGVAISSVAPSSPHLARAFVRDIDWANCRCVVELGAGTGPITEEVVRRAPPTCRTIFLERDPDFCARLRERFPRADVVEADAADLGRVLDERGIGQVDHFLCGLPLPAFPRELAHKILGVVFQRLAEHGTYRQLTHMPYVYYRMHRRYFEQVRFQFVFRNLPPGGFYTCRGPRHGALSQARP